ncbi:hypothetical protein GCM10027615_14090 [Plantactinospora veratri]
MTGALLAGTAGVGAVTASAGCQFRSGDRADEADARRKLAPADALVVELADGKLAVVDAATGRMLVQPAPAVLSGDGRRLVRVERPDGGTRLTSHQLPDGAAVSAGTLTGALAVRTTSSDGGLVALADDAGPGHTPYRPGPRERTTIVVADGAGQRRRLELPGNLEPEAFDTSNRALFVLDYLPPTAPERYRVRVVDLASGRVEPLLTRVKAVVPGVPRRRCAARVGRRCTTGSATGCSPSTRTSRTTYTPGIGSPRRRTRTVPGRATTPRTCTPSCTPST